MAAAGAERDTLMTQSQRFFPKDENLGCIKVNSGDECTCEDAAARYAYYEYRTFSCNRISAVKAETPNLNGRVYVVVSSAF